MSEFPKWIKPHESHDLNLVEKTHQVHHDRVAGVSVLVETAEEEARLMAPFEAPHEEHKDEV